MWSQPLPSGQLALTPWRTYTLPRTVTTQTIDSSGLPFGMSWPPTLTSMKGSWQRRRNVKEMQIKIIFWLLTVKVLGTPIMAHWWNLIFGCMLSPIWRTKLQFYSNTAQDVKLRSELRANEVRYSIYFEVNRGRSHDCFYMGNPKIIQKLKIARWLRFKTQMAGGLVKRLWEETQSYRSWIWTPAPNAGLLEGSIGLWFHNLD